MPEVEIDLLQVRHGTIIAPAGCGKTQLIASALSNHRGEKPVLVLTHTNAGVAALRSRLGRLGVQPRQYRLSTIDGWAMKLISTFPERSDLNPTILQLRAPSRDYPAIRNSAVALVKSRNISGVLRASYAHLLVDEYQDCTIRQHRLVAWAAEVLPTCVLGDPLQAIFGFGADPLANWDTQVCRIFPIAKELNTPWRWILAGHEPLGQWLLDVRGKLLRGESVDLQGAPPSLTWIQLDGTHDVEKQVEAAGSPLAPDERSSLVIGESTSPQRQRFFASEIQGAVTVEAMDLRDLVEFADSFDVGSRGALVQVIEFAKKVMTNVHSLEILRRISSITAGRARNPPTALEEIVIAFQLKPSFHKAADILAEISKQLSVRVHRPTVLLSCLNTLRLCSSDNREDLMVAVRQVREQNRLVGRQLPERSVGSTLLLKGLEADVVVILEADTLDPNNLYVALTRGAKRVVVCSPVSTLNPRRRH